MAPQPSIWGVVDRAYAQQPSVYGWRNLLIDKCLAMTNSLVKRVIVWFRNDLRLHDNEALTNALEVAEEVIPVFVFDDRLYRGRTGRFDFPKTGAYRARFMIESVEDLRDNLRALGSDLIVREGKPEEVLFELAQRYETSWIFCNRERTREEVDVQEALEQRLWTIGQEVRYSRGKMLYHTADLPFPVTHTPDVFSQYRKEVERGVPVRDPLPAPTARFAPLSVDIEAGRIPDVRDFGHDHDGTQDERAAIQHIGGETAALRRLDYYFFRTNQVQTYKETRNGLVGPDFSTKFSAWLANGCISPKYIYAELMRYQQEVKKNKSTYWVYFELLWRDFFRLQAKKYGNRIFYKGGTKGKADPRWRNDERLFNIWAEGRTGVPFIDANMRELNETGYMSNRGRQNVASFLVRDLNVNWQMGAEYMESLLVDYDPTSNWGNWNYVAGVGADPREDRYFNPITQAKRYDGKGEYVKLWIPELAEVPSRAVHRPDTLSRHQQEDYGVILGADYPKAMTPTRKWVR